MAHLIDFNMAHMRQGDGEIYIHSPTNEADTQSCAKEVGIGIDTAKRYIKKVRLLVAV